MRFKIKNVNVSYKMEWAKEWFTNHKIEEKEYNKINSIKDLKNIAPNNEEYEAIKKEFDKLDKHKQKEITDYIKKEINPKLKELSSWIEKPYPIVNEIVKKLQDLEKKIKELNENWDDKYENFASVRFHTQSALLNVMKQNKVANLDWSSIGWWWSSVWWNISWEEWF